MLDLSWVSMDVDNWHWRIIYMQVEGLYSLFLSLNLVGLWKQISEEHVLSGLLVTQAKESCEKAIHGSFRKCKQWVCALVKICTVRFGDKVQYSVCLYVDAYPQGQNMWWWCGSNITNFWWQMMAVDPTLQIFGESLFSISWFRETIMCTILCCRKFWSWM